MVLLLDDERLESLRCSRCHKYLSVFPVKNHSSREVTCGRCSSDGDDGVQSHLYELIAEGYLFRCVNRYEGCMKLLRVNETAAHEQECVGRVFRCPKCEDDVERSILGLIWHYRLDHPSSYLKANRFNAELQREDIMLYVQDEVVFFIRIWYVSNAAYLNVETLTEVNVTQATFISKGRIWEKSKEKLCMVDGAPYVFQLDSVESINVLFYLEVSKIGRLFDVTLPSTSKGQIRLKKTSTRAQQELTVQLSTNFQNKLDYKLNGCGTALLNEAGHKIDLTCSNCKQLIRQPVFRCVKSDHQICNNCCAWCGICNCSVKLSDPNDLLNKINCYLKFPCRWQCREYYYASDVDEHESTCKLKVLKCPKCLFEMDLSDFKLMEIHLLDSHGIINFCEKYDVNRIESFIQKNHNSKVCFMFHNKCCYLKWSYKGWNKNGVFIYDFNFGLFENETNIKLGFVYNAGSSNSSYSYNNNMQNCRSKKLQYCLPYINFNQTDEWDSWS